MKAAKAFGITLITVLLIGIIFFIAKGSILKDVKDTQAESQSTTQTKSAKPITKATASAASVFEAIV